MVTAKQDALQQQAAPEALFSAEAPPAGIGKAVAPFATTSGVTAGFLCDRCLEELRTSYATTPQQCCDEHQRQEQIGRALEHLYSHSIRTRITFV
jgi:hypothetical protein